MVSNKTFHRRVMALISEDQVTWTPIGGQEVIFDYPGAEAMARHVRLGWGEVHGRYLKIKVWNGVLR